MTSDYEIVRYQPSFKNEVVELQKHLWSPRSDLNASYLEWKYERNPYLDDPLIYLALCGGKVVGMRGMFGVRWEAGIPARTFPGIYPDDFVIAPDHRNRGLMTKIMRTALNDLAEKGYPYVYNLSAGPVTLMASLAMGWKNAGSFQPYHIPSARPERFQRVRETIRGMRFFWRFADKLPFRRRGERRQPLQDLLSRLPRSIRKGGSKMIVDRAPRPEDMATLVAKIDYDGRIRHVRDREYLSWRRT
ncbi:MAG: GNAT family N-acetyltransferase, partial [Deltaproteobacteria bacterium]|nr:GNAT family N-acetyltransferase [Deltaproteobacteria bacterium]